MLYKYFLYNGVLIKGLVDGRATTKRGLVRLRGVVADV